MKMTAQTAKNRLLTEKILAITNRLQKLYLIRASILTALDCGDIEMARQLQQQLDDWL